MAPYALMIGTTTATVACTGTNWEYAKGGIAFWYSAPGGTAARAAATLTGNLAKAELSGLAPSTTYDLYAVATTAEGTQHRSPSGSFTTAAAPATSHAGWLELPAKGGADAASEITLTAGERNYTMYYDPSTYSALWVAYPLAHGHVGSGRSGDWSACPNVPTNQQINVWSGSYGVNVGSTIYARGHQIPNGDRNANPAMQKQTFYATNSTPQIQDTFNGSIWNKLEGAVRGAIPSSDSLYVVTGPVYRTAGGSETVKTIRPQHDSKQCPVPNYYYKAVLKVKRAANGTVTSASAIGFWFEHKEYGSKESYENYAVSVDEIERKTGFDFFANLPEAIERTAESNSSWSAFQSF